MDTDALNRQLFGSRVYRDEPILRTAAQMKNYMPPKYREMRKVALQNGRHERTPAEIFCLQGRLMADFEDEYEYTGDFVRYFPTYQTMSDSQLRGYFSWRTQVRKGNIQKTSTSFVFVYLYELLNCIGVADPEEGFHTLRNFYTTYRTMDLQIERYVQVWLRDYVVYYGLDVSLLQDTPNSVHDNALAVLTDYKNKTDEELYPAICTLSSYNPELSRYGKQEPQKMRTAVCAVYRALAEYYEKNRKYTLCEAFFGRSFSTPYAMFNAALFCPDLTMPDRTVQVTPLCSYFCSHGKWYCTRIWGKANKSADLGAVIKATDSLLRERNGYPHTLKVDKTPKYLLNLITRTLEESAEAQRKQAVREITIDLSKLQGIRDAAEVTRDSLIVEEEPEEELPPEPEQTALSTDNDIGLTEAEFTVLRCLLLGENPQDYLRAHGLLLSVVTDAINEKCYDLVADTVLEFDGETPQVIEDYIDELKGVLKL